MSYAQTTCEVSKVKQVLRKVLYLHFTEPKSSPLTLSEVKDLLMFYLSISDSSVTADCSILGSTTNKPISEIITSGESVADKIPTCVDGTKYGECSTFRPKYCYSGSLLHRCNYCGCPSASGCSTDGKCVSTTNIICSSNLDCGKSDFVGDYYCSNNYITRNYVNYTCANPGTINSSCLTYTSSITLSYCNSNLNQVCVNGQSTCSTVNVTNQTTTTGVCLVRDLYTSVPVFSAPDLEKGYAKLAKAGINTISGLQSACTRTDFDNLLKTYCTQNSNPIQEQVMTYDTNGNFQSLSCGAFGCNYRNCSSITANQTNQTTFDTITIKGRYVDTFSSKPLPNIGIKLVKSPSEVLGTFYTNSNGEFAITTSTTDITQGVNKVLIHQANCYMSDNGIAISRYPIDGYLTNFPNYQADAIYVWINYFDLSKTGKYFGVTSPEVNVGDVQLWPSADFSLSSDIPVKFDISYPEEGRGSGNINYLTSHYSRNVIPLVYDVRAQLTDGSGNVYYSPYANAPLSNGCAPVKLNFFNKQFSWNLTTTNQTTTQTCTGVSKTVDFEDPPHLSFHLTWNPDLGTQDSYNYAKDEAARTWLMGKGLVINGTPNGIVWGTKISGPVGVTGVIIGDGSPSFIENDEGISDNEILSVRFIDALTKSVTVGLTVSPSNASSINNVPATVVLETYDKADNLLSTATKTFTGVTNSAYTPTTMSLDSSDFNIAKIKLRTTQHPYNGVWLEDLNFLSCT